VPTHSFASCFDDSEGFWDSGIKSEDGFGYGAVQAKDRLGSADVSGGLWSGFARSGGRLSIASKRPIGANLRVEYRTGDVKAPSWLWSSVVDLLVIHEKAYLEHCRLYALNESH
jgi:hypothetical protein